MASDAKDGFIRQRRNTIIGGLVLWFALDARLTIDRLNVFGNQVNLEHPYSVITFLWVATCYWIIRYLQYFNELGELGFRKSFYSIVHSCIEKELNKLIKKSYSHFFISSNGIPSNCINIGVTHGYEIDSDGIVCSLISRSVDNPYTGEKEILDENIKVSVSISKYKLWLLKIKAAKDITVKTVFFTEYALPLIISMPPVLWHFYTLVKVPLYLFFYYLMKAFNTLINYLQL